MRRVALWLAWWAFLFVVWLLLVDTLAPAEVIGGVLFSAIAAVGAEAVRGSRLVRLRPWGLLPRKPFRLPVTVVTDCWQLGLALWRQLRRPEDNVGAFRGIPFDAGGDDPRSSTRRAVYTATISLTPNTYVVGIDLEENNMLIHELVAGPRATTADRVLGKL